LILFLGAGFSKWTVGLPVARELFDFKIDIWGSSDARKLDIIKSLKETWDKTHPDGQAEQFIADALNFNQKEKEAVLWYLGRRLSEPFIWKEFHSGRWRRHVLMIDEHRKLEIQGVMKARNFLQRFFTPTLSGIITTNYDLLVEYILGTKGFNYGILNQKLIGRGPYPVSQWRNPVTLKGKVNLAKIHGSISWDENGYYTDGRRAITGNALIVAPTPEKHPPESLKFVWDLAERILIDVKRLVVFGFAFSPYDEAVLNLLQTAGQKIKSVLLIDIEPQIERAHHLWPKATIISCLPPPEGDPIIQSWLG